MTSSLVPVHRKDDYRSWCQLFVHAWRKDWPYTRLLRTAEHQGLTALEELPTTFSGFVPYRQGLRSLTHTRLPVVSQRLWDCAQDSDYAMTLLWLMQHPQVACEPKAPLSVVTEVASRRPKW